jgi:hypothetical protein
MFSKSLKGNLKSSLSRACMTIRNAITAIVGCTLLFAGIGAAAGLRWGRYSPATIGVSLGTATIQISIQ